MREDEDLSYCLFKQGTFKFKGHQVILIEARKSESGESTRLEHYATGTIVSFNRLLTDKEFIEESLKILYKANIITEKEMTHEFEQL